MASPLFTGPGSLRDPRERIAFVLTLVFAFPIAALIGTVIHENIGVPEVALFIVIAMLYVTLARGRLIGSSVMIHEAQYPRVFRVVKEICARLEIAMPLIFVREDNYVPVAALGFGEPYALVISSHWVEYFEDDELSFAVGRELGHIAAGHTRYLSLLSVNGNENPIIALIFGGWLRTCASTCDKVGLIACGSMDAAIRSVAMASFHEFGRKIDVEQFAEQGREIASDGTLRLGEWLGAEPYATRRIAAMRSFLATPQYGQARSYFTRAIEVEPPALSNRAGARVTKRDCAGPWRRSWALLIDIVVVFALLTVFTQGKGNTFFGGHLSSADIQHYKDALHRLGPFGVLLGAGISGVASPTLFLTATYLWLLVGFAGQSFGMMITGLRVVTPDFGAPGIWRSLWRYLFGYFLWWIILPCAFFMPRLMLHDRWSGTRLIRAESIMARAASATRYSNG